MVKWQIRCDPDVPGTFRVFRPGADEPLPGYCWSISAAYNRIVHLARRDQHLTPHGYARGGEIRGAFGDGEVMGFVHRGEVRGEVVAHYVEAINHPIQEPCS